MKLGTGIWSQFRMLLNLHLFRYHPIPWRFPNFQNHKTLCLFTNHHTKTVYVPIRVMDSTSIVIPPVASQVHPGFIITTQYLRKLVKYRSNPHSKQYFSSCYFFIINRSIHQFPHCVKHIFGLPFPSGSGKLLLRSEQLQKSAHKDRQVQLLLRRRTHHGLPHLHPYPYTEQIRKASKKGCGWSAALLLFINELSRKQRPFRRCYPLRR